MKGNKKTVLLTGGAGFIGSHTAVELIGSGYETIIADDLSNSKAEVIDRIGEITGIRPDFYCCDVRDRKALDDIVKRHDITSVIHLAGLKGVGESSEKPLEYYRNNIDSALTVMEVMKDHGIKNMVFSSSATVYGKDKIPPLTEDMKKGECSNPYGWTKSMIEQILTDTAATDPELSVVLLRYFNPVGAHESGLIGEDPKGEPNNLMPLLSQVAAGKRDKLTVYGGDYDTPDGTCRRDYIHVMDLAAGHVKAIDYAANNRGVEIFNLGTGNPYSVLEMIKAFESTNGVRIPYIIGERRPGDLPDLWADIHKAEEVLSWKATRNIEDMCRDAWNRQQTRLILVDRPGLC